MSDRTTKVHHHPTICRTGGFGCWATCVCGWKSKLWTTVTGAHLEFGEHLRDLPADDRSQA